MMTSIEKNMILQNFLYFSFFIFIYFCKRNKIEALIKLLCYLHKILFSQDMGYGQRDTWDAEFGMRNITLLKTL